MSEFFLGGAVPADSAAYVHRRFEDDMYSAVVRGSWALVLGPRQHGKSSAIVRLQERLRNDGFHSSWIDLQNRPAGHTYEQLLHWIARQIGGDGVSMPPTDERSELQAWLERALPEGEAPVVLIVDEASALRDPDQRNSLYSQFRAIKNAQSTVEFPVFPSRIRCVFLGTFRHQTMVYESDNSPFNVCEHFITSDLSRDQANELWTNVTNHDPGTGVAEAWELVGGQPYLLQTLFNARGSDGPDDDRTRFDQTVDELRSGQDPHTQSLFREVLDDAGLRAIAEEMCQDSAGCRMRPAQIDYQYMQVLGLATRNEENRLVFRNRLYAEIAKDEFGIARTPLYPMI